MMGYTIVSQMQCSAPIITVGNVKDFLGRHRCKGISVSTDDRFACIFPSDLGQSCRGETLTSGWQEIRDQA